MADWSNSKYFEPQEFDSPDAPGSGKAVKQLLVDRLNVAREVARTPFKITSGYRTLAHNAAVGGKPKSAHLTGEAADIYVKDAAVRMLMLKALLAAGFTRFEITPWHIHVDVARDESHPQNLLLVLDTKEGKLV